LRSQGFFIVKIISADINISLMGGGQAHY
jgi:hypothetical protein